MKKRPQKNNYDLETEILIEMFCFCWKLFNLEIIEGIPKAIDMTWK